MVAGKNFEFLFLITCCVLVYYTIYQANKGNIHKVRSFSVLEAFDPVIHQAAKLNKSVHFTTGIGGYQGGMAPFTIAGLSLLGKVAEICGKYKVPIRYTCSKSYLIPITQDLIEAGYTSAGNAKMYHPDMIVYVGEAQRSFMASVMGYNMREKPAVNMIFGAVFWETINQLGSGAVAGCLNIGGTPRLFYQAVMVCCCEYYLLGDELFAAAAAVDENPQQLGSIRGQDLGKMFAMGLIIFGIIMNTLGSDFFTNLLNW